MIPKSETGYVEIIMIESPGAWHVPLSEYERIHTEWLAGRAFIETVTSAGALLTLKGARIESVHKETAENLANLKELNRLERLESVSEGL